ncbi:MAG: iron-sulfur cluster assembly scaffold protein, partial [Petrotogales bacterium]
MSELNIKILEHFHNPRNVGLIKNADGFGRVENPINNYLTEIYIKVGEGQIKDIKFKTFGCTLTIASASALTESVKGKTLEEIVGESDTIDRLMRLIEEKLGTIPEKNWHCPPTAIQTLLTAIHDYYKKKREGEKVRELEKLITKVKGYFDTVLE